MYRDRPARILVVEDDYLLAEELRATLAGWGYEVVGLVGRGEAALTLAIETEPDLLISDVRLRDSINGVTVGEEVNRRLGAKVIFLTAYPAEALASGRGWGARFLGKPYSPTELRDVIEELLTSESGPDEAAR
ncbi:MAG: response regulator [Alphaproteobacteria bacterium]